MCEIETRRTVHGGKESALSVEVNYWRHDGDSILPVYFAAAADGCGVYIRNPLAMHIQDFTGKGADLPAARASAIEFGKALADHLGCALNIRAPEPAQNTGQIVAPEWAYASLCIWEAMLEQLDKPGCPWKNRRARIGMAALREDALTLAPACEAAWNALDDEGRDHYAPFDWEFVPYWLNKCVAWGGPPSVYAAPQWPLSVETDAGEEPCPINRRPKETCPATCNHGEA